MDLKDVKFFRGYVFFNGDFCSTEGGMVEEAFAYFLGIYIKFGYKNPLILTPLDSVYIAS